VRHVGRCELVRAEGTVVMDEWESRSVVLLPLYASGDRWTISAQGTDILSKLL